MSDGIINPQTQAGRNFAARAGLQPTAAFYWNPLANNWLVWDSTVSVNAAGSNVALENGGNLARLVALLTTAATSSSTQTSDTSVLLFQILMQLQYIATALNAPIVTHETPVVGA